jgi:hypothetical protein
VSSTEEVQAAVRAHEAWIGEEVLALRISIGDKIENSHAAQSVDIDGHPASIAIERAV